MALIEREDAIKAALDWKVKPDDEVFAAIKTAITSNLEQVAAVDAAPVVHGYNVNGIGTSLFECNCCQWACSDTIPGDTKDYNYCPNCGARMDGDPDVHTEA